MVLPPIIEGRASSRVEAVLSVPVYVRPLLRLAFVNELIEKSDLAIGELIIAKSCPFYEGREEFIGAVY